MLFDKKVVLITGAAGGLGRAVVRAFAEQGALLALTDANRERLALLRSELGLSPERCHIHQADLTHLDQATAFAHATEQALSRIDIVVHIAGGFRMGDVHETSESDWNFLMDLNARSAFNLAHGVVPIMKRQGSGAIIHIGARAALKSDAHVGVYAASKAALLRLSESMAAELLDSGIRVNCVLPSTIDTEANRKAMPAADPKKWVAPESIAEVILFLCSPAARDISGAQIPVYGRS
ncbi:MAG TPA: SDR family NAD(P)-dependent oxidoreductase [Pseudomonadota bacterium]|nr:SDR family NAD(P)-dependent oxidoreductase [Pseudomonadota bacterium]